MNNNPRGIRTTSQHQTTANSGIGTRHSSISGPSNNNIHININLNVKKKTNCIHGNLMNGKKINNFIEITDSKSQLKDSKSAVSQEIQKNHHLEQSKGTALGRKKFISSSKQQFYPKKQENIKKQKNKIKQKITSKPLTPQKDFKYSSQQKSLSKSKTKKLTKKKDSKSMQNIRVFKQKPTSVKDFRKTNQFHNQPKEKLIKQRQKSSSKEKSRSKSSKKLKRNRSSSKNITSFQNSGIKKIFAQERVNEQPRQTRKYQTGENLAKSKKSLKQKVPKQKIFDKVFVIKHQAEQKRKTQPIDRKQLNQKIQNKTKKIKIKEELINQKTTKHRKSVQQNELLSNKNVQPKVPMFFGSDDELQDSTQQYQLKQKYFQINKHSDQKSKAKSKAKSKNASPIKKTKFNTYQVQQSIFDRFQNDKLSKFQKREFLNSVIKIQSFWRGYKVRKTILQQLMRINKISNRKKNQIFNQKFGFWDDDENNSIIDLELINEDQQREEQKSQKRKNNENSNTKKSKEQNKSPIQSNFNSSSTPTDQNHTNHKKYESQSGPQKSNPNESQVMIADFNKNLINMKNAKKFPVQQQKSQKSQKSSFENTSYLTNQIQQLRKQMQQQSKKFAQLERQNNQLKQNLQYMATEKQQIKKSHLSIDQSEPIKSQKKQINAENKNSKHNSKEKQQAQFDEIEFYELKKPQTKHNQQNLNKRKTNDKFRNLKIETQVQVQNIVNENKQARQQITSPSQFYVKNLKRQFQTYESPSNRSLQNLSSQNVQNLQKVFKKKQLSVDIAYEKNSKVYQQMLQNNIVSPRTYNFKKVELDQKYKKQKQQINSKFKEVQKVIKYIKQQIVQQQNIGEDQSPQKPIIFDNDTNIQGVRLEDLCHTSEKIELKVNDNTIKHDNLSKQINQYINNEFESSIEGQQLSNFKKYWTNDAEQLHKKALQISSRIDQALDSDSKYSESLRSDSNKQYSSQNSNYNAIEVINNEEHYTHKRNESQPPAQTPIYEEAQYQINSYDEAAYQTDVINDSNRSKNTEVNPILNNNSNLSSSSDKSSNKSAIYDIHYPSSPSNKDLQQHKDTKHFFQLKEQVFIDNQNSVQANHSSLSQNRSSSSSVNSGTSLKPKEPRGFDTRLTFIKEYCIALCQFIRSEQDLKKQFIENISSPLKYDYFQYLKFYRTTVDNQNSTKYNSTVDDYLYPFFKIISKPKIQRALNDNNYTRFQQLYGQMHNSSQDFNSEIHQIRNYFLKAVIDVFNQSLDFERPGSIYGEPLPWLVQSKNLKNNPVKLLKQPQNHHKKSYMSDQQENSQDEQNEEDERLDKIFGVAIAKIIQWGSCLCGFIPEPVSFDNDQAQSVNIDQQQTNIVRQTRLAYMLQKYLAQNQESMIDSTMEQLEINLQVQQIVFHDLIEQAINQLIPLLGLEEQ